MERAKRRRRRWVVAVALASCLLIFYRTLGLRVSRRPGGLLDHFRQRVRLLFLAARLRCQQWLTGLEVGTTVGGTTVVAQQVQVLSLSLMCRANLGYLDGSFVEKRKKKKKKILVENFSLHLFSFCFLFFGFFCFQPSPPLSYSVPLSIFHSRFFSFFLLLRFCCTLFFHLAGRQTTTKSR